MHRVLRLLAVVTLLVSPAAAWGETPKLRLIDASDAALLLLDHQTGLFQTVKDIGVTELRTNATVLARVGEMLKLPVITTASVPDGPNGPLMPELGEAAPSAIYVPRKGEIDVGFGSIAQIDKYGNCNIVCIGDYNKPKVRLIGPIFQPGHLALFGREVIIFGHQKRKFVDKVDFVTGVGFGDGPGSREKLGLIGGGPSMVLTDKAVFDFDPQTKLMRVRSVHPGVSADWVRQNTGFTHSFIAKEVPETPGPTDEELRLIREVIDPRGVLLPR